MFSRSLVLLSVLLIPALGSAQGSPVAEPAHLTARGRQMISGSVGGSWSSDDSGAYGSPDKWSVYGHPAWMFFPRAGQGIGLAAGGGISSGGQSFVSYKDRDISLGVKGLSDLRLSQRVSLFFELYVGYVRQWRDVTFHASLPAGVGAAPGATFQQPYRLAPLRDSVDYVRLAFSMPLVVHLSSSVGLGFGPDLWLDVLPGQGGGYGASSKPYRIQLGASSSLFFSF